MPTKRILSGVGRVIYANTVMATVAYRAELDSEGTYPLVVELGDLPLVVPEDARLTLELQDGRRLTCLRLDRSNLCVGEGIEIEPSLSR
jgi:hypothetical protein